MTQGTAGSQVQGKVSGSFVQLASFQSTPVGGVQRTNVMVRLMGNASGNPSPAMREPDAAGIDLRYDDGSPVSGSITTGASSAATCNTGGQYTLGAGNPTTNYCVMMFVVQ
jgi:hypothetical protein